MNRKQECLRYFSLGIKHCELSWLFCLYILCILKYSCLPLSSSVWSNREDLASSCPSCMGRDKGGHGPSPTLLGVPPPHSLQDGEMVIRALPAVQICCFPAWSAAEPRWITSNIPVNISLQQQPCRPPPRICITVQILSVVSNIRNHCPLCFSSFSIFWK